MSDGAVIRLHDLRAQYLSIQRDIDVAIERLQLSQAFILGDEVHWFETECAAALGRSHAIGVASGSDALYLSLLALGVGEGDEVVTSPFGFIATAMAISRVGAQARFVDIDPHTFNLDTARAAESAITSTRVRAFLPVHLFGRLTNLAPLGSAGVPIVEDCAQSVGARSSNGSVSGALGCLSFFPTKNLGGMGDGGMVVTDDAGLDGTLRVLRANGQSVKYTAVTTGINSRLDALQAAILRAKLTHLAGWNARRVALAAVYRQLFTASGLLEHVRLPSDPGGDNHVYHQFVVRVPRRSGLREHLLRAGIETGVYYPTPLHTQPAFAHWGYRPGQFPHAELACSEVLALPIHPHLSDGDVEQVVAAVGRFFRG